jgi:hypothetical protein
MAGFVIGGLVVTVTACLAATWAKCDGVVREHCIHPASYAAFTHQAMGPPNCLPPSSCLSTQYTTPFSSVDLTKMAEAFNTTVG